MRRVLVAVSVVLAILVLTAACEDQSPAGPTSSSALEQFVQALREQGLSVSVGDEIGPEVNRFFSVPARQIRTNDTHVNAFVYPSAAAAAAEAASISPDGQPSPTVRVTWVSTPRFYRQGSLIVLYVGCSGEVTRALEATLGAPLAVGPAPCGTR